MGREAQIIKFPDRTTTFGKQIDSFLKQKKAFEDKMLHLLFSINRWELKDHIIESLSNNVDVILDRYSYSGIAYSNAKGIDLGWCSTPERGLPKPDIVIYLKADNVEELSKREGYGEEIFERTEFQKKVKHVYESKLLSDDWFVINASESIENVRKNIASIIQEVLEKREISDIQLL